MSTSIAVALTAVAEQVEDAAEWAAARLPGVLAELETVSPWRHPIHHRRLRLEAAGLAQLAELGATDTQGGDSWAGANQWGDEVDDEPETGTADAWAAQEAWT